MQLSDEGGFSGVRVLEALDIESLPVGRTSQVLVELVHDGLGRPIRVPMFVARGRLPGPTFGLTAAVHGNELTDVPVMHQVFDWLDPKKLKGTVVGVIVVNVPGLLMFQREFIDGSDLNRSMPGRANGNISQVYAHRFLDRIVRCFDFLADLHTASFGRANSLYVRADMTHPVAAKMAYLQRPQIIVHSPAADGTLRGTAMTMNIPAITVEIGDPQLFKQELIRRSVLGIRAMLSELGMLTKTKIALGADPVVCDRSSWVYTDHGGLLQVLPKITERVQANDVVARLTNVFGELTREYRAPEAGVVVGLSTNPVSQTGARIVHLGRVVDPAELSFQRRGG